MSKTLPFVLSKNGKVRNLECPYVDMYDERVRLTATQYQRSKRCLCSVCWAKRPEYYAVQAFVWEKEEIK